MKILVVVPAYNEEKNIVKTIEQLKAVKLKRHIIDYIVINDGASDNTYDVCINNNISLVNLPFNLGIGGAVQTGYKYAYRKGYDVVIQFDGDGQHNAFYIKGLVEEIEKGNNIVIGSRFIRGLSRFKSTKLRRIGIKILSWLIKIMTGKRIYDPTSGFRAVDKEIIKLFAINYPIDFPEPDTIVTVIKKGYRVSEIPVEMTKREHGKSSIDFIKSIYYMIKVSLAIIIAALSVKKGID